MLKPAPMNSPGRRLVLISNRLPVSLVRSKRKWQVLPSAGGLVTALGPVLRNRGGLWIGWPGVATSADLGRVLEQEQDKIGYSLTPVQLTRNELDNFYLGFSNEIVWPLFHGLVSQCNYDPNYWEVYVKVNRKFGENIARYTKPDDFIWVHDYHLMSTAKFLREQGVESMLSFFLHIPFPPPDFFFKLPWRQKVLRSLLDYDLIGFQTARHKRNFLQSIRIMFKRAEFERKGPITSVSLDGRQVRIAHFPIGIDFKAFLTDAGSPEVARQVEELRNGFPGQTIVLGVDRLDYTKGITYKLKAFGEALRRYPRLRGKITLVQVVIPSRGDIPSYNELKAEIDQLVGEINSRLAVPGWTPIHYIFRTLKREELLAHYRVARIALITPLEDGMNLVAKEYCAAGTADDSVLILSEFAGAAAQLGVGALLVNPYDVEGMAEAILTAYSMRKDERSERMRKLRKSCREYNIFWWVDSFLKAGNFDLGSYPSMEERLPDQVDDSWWWEVD